MKIPYSIFLVLGLICGLSGLCQQSMDTIHANSQMNVALFFPSPIQQAVTGQPGIVFSYDREEAGYLGLLQAKVGTVSNLLVVTMDGQAYDFIVDYRNRICRTHYFVGRENSIGSVRPLPRTVPDSLVKGPSHLYVVRELLSDHGRGALRSVRRKGIRLSLEKMVHMENKVYMVIEVRNRSDIDFDMGNLEVFRVNGTGKRRSSYQEKHLVPLLEHRQIEVIKVGNAHQFVIGFPKFVQSPNERLKIILWEKNGSRKIVLHY